MASRSEEDGVALDEEEEEQRQQQQQQQPSSATTVGLMNNAFFSNFGETLSQYGNIAKENAEKLKEQIRLSQMQQTLQQQRDEQQQEKKKNKGDYVRLPIESAKRLRALDTQDVNELEMLHKAQIAKVLSGNELLGEKVKQLSTSENLEEK